MKTLRTTFVVLSAIMFAVGAGLIALWLVLDLHGFFKGTCQGAGFTLLVGSVFVAVRYARQGSKGGEPADWLPSRDGNGTTGWLPRGGERP
ncbi:hypothetical protein GD627_02005 [Arthrobacter yangruifuii]|uniref:Uncharacterized protein n=1 Tax=Arthrobacter yangruifuii TaxID=2606616 RepID=A0A5N6MSV3_9MICC|nr:hypothetical protein [Arthrobacter yangruifuii]KAD4059883.1 hypothetical protein GD627_02005 [Arthrobacter yangruifuii]